MKKNIGIITIIDKSNLGNRLQNYALQTYLNKITDANIYTLNNNNYTNNRKFLIIKTLKNKIKENARIIIKKIIKYKSNENYIKRKNNFSQFDKNIKYYKKTITAYSNLKKFNYVIVGSDQVWNSNINRLSDIDVLKYVNNCKKISYAASFGVNNLNNKDKKIVNKELKKFKSISVRELQGKEIVENITERKDIEVLLDPTMLLTNDEWEKVAKKPNELKSKKYILNYFLGELSSNRKKEIQKIAKENNCDIINILDPNDPLYSSGPSEFLYLEKNAFLICTDSFHSCVFSILFNVPFIVFEREQNSILNMNSRIDTLLSKFELNDRKYNQKNITKENLNCDYSKVENILKKEREKSKLFLKNALDIGKKYGK